jgi:hypothetical protein
VCAPSHIRRTTRYWTSTWEKLDGARLVVYVSTGSCSSLGLHPFEPQLSTTCTMNGRVVVQFFCSRLSVRSISTHQAGWQLVKQRVKMADC